MKILIIDDSKAMRSLLTHMVRELGFESVTAEDGRAALDLVEQRADFNVALVDWDMPRMNGYEFIKAVRAEPRHRELKLMMVTAQNTMERVAEAITAGASEFLMKPVSKQSLEAKLRVLGVVA